MPAEAEFGKPQWTFSQWTYEFLDERRIVASYTERGQWKLGVLQIDPPRFDPVPMTLEPLDGLRVGRDAIYFIGGSPTHSSCITQVPLDALVGPPENAAPVPATVIRPSTADPIPPRGCRWRRR